jgi:hypothetical protein
MSVCPAKFTRSGLSNIPWNSTGERRHGDGAIAKLMAVYAFLQDAEAGYMPMTYEAVKTENRCRAGGKDAWDEQAICMRNRRFQFSTRTAIPEAIFRFCTNSRRNASPSF